MELYNVTGMSCAACSAHVEKAVMEVPGVTSVAVSLLTNSMNVEGTAAPSQVKGYSFGGKTGTAEKRPVSAKKYLVSFIGCEPAEDPEVAYYVIIDEPHVKDQAHSTYATEFSSKVMKRVLPFLGQYASSSQTKQDAKQD